MTADRRWPGYPQARRNESRSNSSNGPYEAAFARPDTDQISNALSRYASRQEHRAPTGNVVAFSDPRERRAEPWRYEVSTVASNPEATGRSQIAPEFPKPSRPQRDSQPAVALGPLPDPLIEEVHFTPQVAPAEEAFSSKGDVLDQQGSPGRRTPAPYRLDRHGVPPHTGLDRLPGEPERSPDQDARQRRRHSKAGPPARSELKIGPAPSSPQPRLRREPGLEDDEARRQRMAVYFGKRSVWTSFSLAAGAFLIFNPSQYHPIYGFELTIDRAFVVGLAVFLVGLYFRYMRVQRPSDEEVDEWTIDDLKASEVRALELIALDGRETISEPVVLTGFPDIARIGSSFRDSRYGRDNVLRFTPRGITVFCFTEDMAISYEAAVDLLTGHIIYEHTSEFFYRDIANVGLQKSAVPRKFWSNIRFRNRFSNWQWNFMDRLNRIVSGRLWESAVQRNTREVFQIKLADGETIKVVLRDGRLAGNRVHDEIPVTTDDRIIRVVREVVAKMKNEQLRGNVVARSRRNI